MTTKSSDSADLRYRLFSSSDNLWEQSRNNRADKEFSVSRSNQAHRYSNSLHQTKSDRRIDRFSVHTHRSDDSRRSDKITDQKQIRSVSSRFKDRIRLATSNRIESRDHDESTSCENLFQRSYHLFLYNLRSLLSVVFACKKWVRMKICFCMKKSKKRYLRFFDRFLRELKMKNRSQIMFCVRVSQSDDTEAWLRSSHVMWLRWLRWLCLETTRTRLISSSSRYIVSRSSQMKL
jgi:predicted nucleic acid-binding protein